MFKDVSILVFPLEMSMLYLLHEIYEPDDFVLCVVFLVFPVLFLFQEIEYV